MPAVALAVALMPAAALAEEPATGRAMALPKAVVGGRRGAPASVAALRWAGPLGRVRRTTGECAADVRWSNEPMAASCRQSQ